MRLISSLRTHSTAFAVCLALGATTTLILAAGNSALAAAPDATPAGQAAPDQSRQRWIDPDGNELPFESAEELLDFMRTADIVERERISIGINGIDRVVLEKDGIRVRGGWRDVDVREKDLRVGRERYRLFRDSYIFECAAYEMALMLGIDNIPPTILRSIGRRKGSLQLWLENLRGDDDGEFKPKSAQGWTRQLWTMNLFDALVYNVDRNAGNLLVDFDDKLWLIDHTRAFQIKNELLGIERVTLVSRRVWENLQAIDPDEMSRRLTPFLESQQTIALRARLEKLIAYIQSLIDQRGEEAVLF